MSLLRAAEEAGLKEGGYRRKGKRARYRSDVLKLSRVIFVFPWGFYKQGWKKWTGRNDIHEHELLDSS